MAILIAFIVISGILAGKFLFSSAVEGVIEPIVTYLLALMVFSVGLDIGRNKDVFRKLKQFGWKIAFVPISIAAGSFAGAIVVRFVIDMPLKEALAVSAGFGWYSLSGVLIAQTYSVQLGTIAFLANVFRELIAFMLIPILAKHVCSKLTAIAPGAATTMDSTLPLIRKVTDTQTALIAFVNGLILSGSVPFFIPFFLNL